MSAETGDVATVVKLLRVAMLLPVIVITVVSYRRSGAEPGAKRPPLLPGFAIVRGPRRLNSFNAIPSTVAAFGSDVSRWCLVAAVAALGTKTRLRELAEIGFKPVALMVAKRRSWRSWSWCYCTIVFRDLEAVRLAEAVDLPCGAILPTCS
jgi:Predicted membrane protein